MPNPRLSDIFTRLPHFLSELELGMLDHGLSLGLGPMDHLCYRAADNQEYLEVRSLLTQFGAPLVEGMIGGRPIITFALTHPLPSAFGPIPCLELAAPKAGGQHLHGFEHGEIVVPNLQLLLDEYPWVPFDRCALHNTSPELRLTLGAYQVKFHCQSLADTIAQEIARNQVLPVPENYFSA